MHHLWLCLDLFVMHFVPLTVLKVAGFLFGFGILMWLTKENVRGKSTRLGSLFRKNRSITAQNLEMTGVLQLSFGVLSDFAVCLKHQVQNRNQASQKNATHCHCSDKKLLGAPGLTTRSKDATRGSWHRY